MLTFLFWNVNRKPVQSIIARLANTHGIDVIILTECDINPADLLIALNVADPAEYHYVPPLGCEKINFYVRFPSNCMRPIKEGNRFTIQALELPGRRDILVTAVHGVSKRDMDAESQIFGCAKLERNISLAEQQVKHCRTILVGDFNMNPFEPGLIAAGGLHAVMCRSIARERSRTVQDEDYQFFYNPMWSLWGDASPGPPGTYYYRRAEYRLLFWNMFDQVLIRPDLLEYFHNEDLVILDSDGTSSLLSRGGYPDTNVASDHLPILFKFRL